MKKFLVPGYNGYRPDVDGLRAVAVLSVILFHIDETLVPGGFVGVDIFFVISGFLISRNIIQDIQQDRFTILDFYRRRIKRIVPPMLLVVAATVVIAQIILLPLDAEWVADSALWSLASLANVYFWQFQDLSYFAADSKELPLLHLWSLGVEEQFYFIWPLLLLMIGALRRPRLLIVCIAAIIVGSFVLGELIFERSPMFAYYMLPSRAGELLFGALVAVAIIKNVDRYISKIAAFTIAWSGVALLIWSLFALSEMDRFPGLNAIPPTLGTALIIFAGHCQRGILFQALSVRPVVWVGLVSYSAYLWHWPLLAFVRYGFGEVTPIFGLLAFLFARMDHLSIC